MVTIHATPPASQSGHGRARLRRWLVGLLIASVLLVTYALALRWFSEQVGQDVQETLREVPVLDDHTPHTN